MNTLEVFNDIPIHDISEASEHSSDRERYISQLSCYTSAIFLPYLEHGPLQSVSSESIVNMVNANYQSASARTDMKRLLCLGDNPNILQIIAMVKKACRAEETDTLFDLFSLHDYCRGFFDRLNAQCFTIIESMHSQLSFYSFQ